MLLEDMTKENGLTKNPTYKIISEMVPDNPVYMDGSTGFSAYGNKLAMIEAGITRDAEDPVGGIIHRDEKRGTNWASEQPWCNSL